MAVYQLTESLRRRRGLASFAPGVDAAEPDAGHWGLSLKVSMQHSDKPVLPIRHRLDLEFTNRAAAERFLRAYPQAYVVGEAGGTAEGG